MDKKSFFIRRTTMSCIKKVISGFIGMSWSKLIFDNVVAGLVLFQVMQMVNQCIDMGWAYYLNKDRTRLMRFQKWLLPRYNIVKTTMVILDITYAIIVFATNFNYIIPLLYFFAILNPINSLINSIEDRLETVIMGADDREDIDYLESKSGVFKSMSTIIGTGISSLSLTIFNLGVWPLYICITLSTIVSIMDDIELSRYINLCRDQLHEYFDVKIITLKGKGKYNENIA